MQLQLIRHIKNNISNKLKAHYKIWSENKILSLCVLIGLLASILIYVIFKEILWMGIVCFFIGVGKLYQKYNRTSRASGRQDER